MIRFSLVGRQTVRRWAAMLSSSLVIPLLLAPSCDQPTESKLTNTAADTSSHNFVWDETRIGYDHTVLRDVFAVSDTDVWVVGDITEWDATNRCLIHHNAAHWNGSTWEMHDLMFHTTGTSHFFPMMIFAVYGFGSNNIVFCTGGQIQRWNGNSFALDERPHGMITGPVTGIWGSSDKDIWFVGEKGVDGTKGFIVHYDGTSYRSFDPGFNEDINDVWGVGDTALCIASDWFHGNSASSVLRLVNGSIEKIYSNGLVKSLKCIWYGKGMNPVATGAFDMQWNGSKWEAIPGFSDQWFCLGLRGMGRNDYFMIRENAEVFHYNGMSWREWQFGEMGAYYYLSISCIKDNVWIVGETEAERCRGLIIHGKRIPPSPMGYAE